MLQYAGVIDLKESGAQEAAFRMRALGATFIKMVWVFGLGVFGIGAGVYWLTPPSLTGEAVSCIGPLGADCPQSQPVNTSVETVGVWFVGFVVAMSIVSLLVWALFYLLAKAAYNKALREPAPSAF